MNVGSIVVVRNVVAQFCGLTFLFGIFIVDTFICINSI
jgi:hypothetical protein